MQKWLLLGLTALLAGCVTTPTTTETSKASYVGDRGGVTLDEVVVSVPINAATPPQYHNLHVTVAALVNPKHTTFQQPYEVEAILHRAQPRIAAHLSESLSALGQQSLFPVDRVRKHVQTEAQATIDQVIRQWKGARDYTVEIVVVNLYWTDSSVGRATQQRRGWW
jgi:hypothetical protein